MIHSLQQMYPALWQRNFRYYWAGQCISLIGTWMQTTGQQWLIYSMTKSAFLLGMLGAAQFLPMMLFSLPVGVFIDRYPKKKILLLTQTALMLQGLILATLIWSGHVSYWNVLLLAGMLGIINTIDQPTRQSFMPELVNRPNLRNAIGLNSAIVNLARIAGPALAALLMEEYGAALLFFLNALSFLPVLLSIFYIKTLPLPELPPPQSFTTEIRDGLIYIFQTKSLRTAIAAMLVIGTFIMNFNVITPLYAAEILGEGIYGYGVLMSASGIGSLISAFIAASWLKKNPSFALLLSSGLLLSFFFTSLQFIHSLSMAIAAFVLIGFFNILFLTTTNSLLQINSADRFRGRVMSVYSLAFLGTTPLGNLFAGSIIEHLGAGIGIGICGFISLGLLSLLLLKTRFGKTNESP